MKFCAHRYKQNVITIYSLLNGYILSFSSVGHFNLFVYEKIQHHNQKMQRHHTLKTIFPVKFNVTKYFKCTIRTNITNY